MPTTPNLWMTVEGARAAIATDAGVQSLLRHFDAERDTETLLALGGNAICKLFRAGGWDKTAFVEAAESAVAIYAATQRGREALAIIDVLLDSTVGLQPRTYTTALWAVQDANTHLGVDPARAARYLARALPMGSEYPEIFFNACALSMELGDRVSAIAHARDAALNGYRPLDAMRRCIENDTLFAPARAELLAALAAPRRGFTEEALSRLPSTITMPAPIIALFRWLEKNGMVAEDARGGRYAPLHGGDDHPRGTQIIFWVPSPVSAETFAKGWLPRRQNASERLVPFARTGGDGSHAALWLDDDGNVHIVHLGSGSGSTFLGLIATNPVDFLRLIGIGYPEICWAEDYAYPPERDDEAAVTLHDDYRGWVESTFGVTIPEQGSAIVPAPVHMDEQDDRDPFSRWVQPQRS